MAEERSSIGFRPDRLAGLLLATVGLFLIVFGFSHAETPAWSDHYTIGFLAVGVVLLALFAFVETRAKYPLLPMRIVLDRTRGGSLAAMLFASIGIFGVFLFLTYYLQGTLGWSPVKTGVGFLPLVAGLVFTAQLSNNFLLPKIGPKIIIPVGLLVAAAALYQLHGVGLHTAYVSHVLPYLIVLGLGFGLSLAPAFSTGTIGLEPHDAGVGSATLNTSQQIGGSIGTALLNTLAGSAAVSYLVGKIHSKHNEALATLHNVGTTAFRVVGRLRYSELLGAVGPLLLVAPGGNLSEVLTKAAPATEVSAGEPRVTHEPGDARG